MWWRGGQQLQGRSLVWAEPQTVTSSGLERGMSRNSTLTFNPTHSTDPCFLWQLAAPASQPDVVKEAGLRSTVRRSRGSAATLEPVVWVGGSPASP